MSFLQTATENHTAPLELEEIQDLIEIYTHRLEAELDTIKAERRTGRPASTREEILKLQLERDAREHASGFWIPDLQNVETLATLKGWGGEWVSMNTMSFVRISKDGTVLPSSFPPKGQS